MGLLSFLSSWQFVVLFYAFIVVLVYYKRNNFEFQAKFIALYKTKLGLKLMNTLGTKFRKIIVYLGYIGIIVGYLGMLVIVYYMFDGMLNLILTPDAPPTVTPVIPGVKIPGSPIFVPFWYGIISLFIVIVIHEFSHGVVSRAHKIRVKSSGFVLFGPLPGAFVEPDEKQLVKKKASIQNSVFAAGPFSNILTALLVLVLFLFVFAPIVENNYEPNGISFSSITPGSPADKAGFETGVRYNMISDLPITNAVDFVDALDTMEPGYSTTIDGIPVTLGEHPDKEGDGYLGVNIVTRFTNDQSNGFKTMQVLIEFLNWLFLLSLGLGLANLLPIGPVDGGRMFQIGCRRFLGKKKGDVVWAKVSILFLILIVTLLIIPILRAII